MKEKLIQRLIPELQNTRISSNIQNGIGGDGLLRKQNSGEEIKGRGVVFVFEQRGGKRSESRKGRGDGQQENEEKGQRRELRHWLRKSDKPMPPKCA